MNKKPVKPGRDPRKKGPIGRRRFEYVVFAIIFFIVICLIQQGRTDETNNHNKTKAETSVSKGDLSTTSQEGTTTQSQKSDEATIALENIPDYSGSAYVAVNDNVPYFTDEELTTTSYEFYSELDSLGRCGVVYACVGKEIMPTEERGSIGQVKPTGWNTVKYDIVDGNYLYNRCHLIGYQLTGENANKKNLITGTRSMNVDGMLPFENMVADYVTETGNHVMYRVTPIFDGDNLVANGVLMEAKSVEDDGEGILFNVFVYNVQEGIVINYATGDSSLEEVEATKSPTETNKNTYILNTNTKKFHYSGCSSTEDINAAYYDTYTGDREVLIDRGYDACKRCNP